MHDDLLTQAILLAKQDINKPRQVSLRRAVSTVYYAVFHFLIDEACRHIMGTQHGEQGYRNVLGRAFSHATMKDACSSFLGGSLPKVISKGLPKTATGQYVILTEIKNMARVFVDLQEKRHLADYDRTERFTRAGVRQLIEDAQEQILNFQSVPLTSNEKRFFLACLLTWKELKNRS